VYFLKDSIRYIPASTGVPLEIGFVDANPVEPIGERSLGGVKNFIKGSDPEGWISNVSSYYEVVYADVWDGIDLKFYINEGMLKYDMIVHVGADPSIISFDYTGVNELSIEPGTGDLVIQTTFGTFKEGSPLSYQETGSGKDVVDSAYRVIHKTVVGVAIGEYDESLPLVIDPGLEFGTYFGGSSRDWLRGGMIDDYGNIIIAGNTPSDDLPTTAGAFCETLKTSPPLSVTDGYIAKFNHNATRLLFCTYIGGTLWDTLNGMNMDPDGNIYIVGATGSDDFPLTQDAIFNKKRNHTDCYFAQLDPTGSRLLFSTLLGGSTQNDFIFHIEVGKENNVFVGGTTGSHDFPVTNDTLSSTLQGVNDMYVLNISMARKEITWGTFIGGSGLDGDQQMILLDDGDILMAGFSDSVDFPVTKGAYCESFNGGFDDIVVFRLSSDGKEIKFGTYIGGSKTASTRCSDLELNKAGEIWICGHTSSDDFPTTPDAYAPEVTVETAVGYFSKFNQDCSELVYSSFMPGLGGCDAMTLTPEGDPIFFMRVGPLYDYPCPTTSWNPVGDGWIDDFIMWMDIDNRSIYNSTYIGSTKVGTIGRGNDYVTDIQYKEDGTLLLLGVTVGDDFPTTDGAFCRTWSSGEDGFIAGFSMEKTPWDVPPSPLNLTVEAEDEGVTLRWKIPDFEGYWPLRGFRIYYGETEECSDGVVETPVTTMDAVTGLRNGRNYYFKVAAFSAVGEGLPTPAVNTTPFGIPTAPLDLKATGDFEAVHLSWSPPEDMRGMPVLGYLVNRGTSYNYQRLLADIDNVTNYIDTEIVTGETYYYNIQAYHALAPGSQTKIANATPYGPPTVPQYLQGERGNGSVTLTWRIPERDGGLSVQSYRVYRGTTVDTLVHITYIITGTTFLDTEVYNGITYYYAVSAVNTAAEGPRTPIVQVTPSGSSHRPREFTILEGDGEVTLTWDPPDYTGGSPVAAYWIYRGTTEDTMEFLTDAGTNGSFTDTSLENGQTYHYQVRAVTAAGPGDPTIILSALPLGRPGRPEGFTATPGDSVVDLLWLAPVETGGSDILFFRIYREDTPDRLNGLSDVPAGTTRFTDTSVEVGRTYHYAVTAGNQRLESEFSDVLQVTVTGSPWYPSNFTGAAGDGAVTLSWDPPLNTGGVPLQGYNIYVGDSEDDIAMYRNMGYVHTYTVSGLDNGRTYWFGVQAVNEWGESIPAGPYSFMPLGLPSPPIAFKADVLKTLVTLTWEPPEDDGGSPVKGYKVFRWQADVDMEMIAELGMVTTHLDIGMERGQTYHYIIVAVTDIGESDDSSQVSAVIEVQTTTEPPDGLPLWMLAVGLVGVVVVGLAAAASTEPGRYELTLWALPLLARFQKDDILNNRTRYAIIGIITDNPGIHFKAILKEFDVPAGAAVHHLNVLEKEHYIRSVRDGRLKRFYLAGTKIPDNLRMTPEEVRVAVVDLVAMRPGISQKEVIDELGIDRDTVGYHLRELVGQGRLEDEKKGKYTVYRIR
jgi:fibronectin type 3 domain-containing protein/DNA-binding transcriptional ArsR family regulator